MAAQVAMAEPATSECLPVYYIPHGGGPCFFMDPPPHAPDTWLGMAAFLRSLPADVGATPRALLVVSAHWETPRVCVNASVDPGLFYDYYGFPDHTYRLNWPARGAPDLARQVAQRLAAAGWPCDTEQGRGLDHGVFIPLMLAYPQAQVPVVQLSLLQGLDPAAHLALGAALQPLREQGVLILGSGMSYHNLRQFFHSPSAADAASERFDAWLAAVLAQPDDAQRNAALRTWLAHSDARACHPREEHLLPLMVVAGAAGKDAAEVLWRGKVFGKTVSALRFGRPVSRVREDGEGGL